MPGETARQNGIKGGRPKGTVASKTLQTQIMRARLAQRLYDKMDAIFDAWEDLALGHYIMVKNPLTGEQRVYKKGPNGLALKDMMEQVWGKPTQPITVGEHENEPDFELEALQRMGKYVEPTDAEFTERISTAPAQPALSREVHSLRGVGTRFAKHPANHAQGVDTTDAQKQV